MSTTNTAKVQSLLVRLVQICFVIFYLYLGLVYVGMILLVPLGAFYHLFSLLHLALPAILSAPLALALVAGAAHLLYSVPKVWDIVVESGLNLLEQAMAQIHDLGALARTLMHGTQK